MAAHRYIGFRLLLPVLWQDALSWPLATRSFRKVKHFESMKLGCSIIFSSHQMEHIEEFCEKMVLLVKGKSILEGYIYGLRRIDMLEHLNLMWK